MATCDRRKILSPPEQPALTSDVQLKAPLGTRTLVQALDGKPIRKDAKPYSDGHPWPTITATAG
ncbi:hypothetical protein IEE94_07925 [Yimella sp. cx-573]|nr:hypothetical protein [Yimella sp. cx-573]